MQVTLSYPNGQTEDVLLADAPAKGDFIRLRNGPGSPALVVERRIWVEGRETPPEPVLLLIVRQQEDS